MIVILRIKFLFGAAYLPLAAAEGLAPLAPYSLQLVLRLEKGEEIDLFLRNGSLFDTDVHHMTHFIGYLIE